eukprot:CAMPEP_0170346298 /NCGR_PEP_ID=MMETSP0116_2-20130129/74398_1 /TAXON_ID=400756 /ORGANISM="Durinskia baltica, Strain CSIRO CS-38" /LENGTH=39 /DNA_ID= /DNA_START= /DNA_END= /DNA_ORIENTATION=
MSVKASIADLYLDARGHIPNVSRHTVKLRNRNGGWGMDT